MGPAYYTDPSGFPELDAQLKSAYTSSLELAREHGLRTVGFALISAGIFAGTRGKPAVLQMAYDAVFASAGQLHVVLVAWSPTEQTLLQQIAEARLSEGPAEHCPELASPVTAATTAGGPDSTALLSAAERAKRKREQDRAAAKLRREARTSGVA